ncbi:ABC-2 type transport system permease protein [Salana multivorans]|uniref:ABC-2 type transport system permease protein n=1 Tax=Salana multivorans TaxID=120377 RepID=A0A3N2DCA5_9MICO|nr:ABC transporter permease [Salana multivorans]ROR97431.1 ABC-2 type transport system permease protein [Salana multivorans]
MTSTTTPQGGTPATSANPSLSSWSATWLVAEREVTSQIRSKSFVISNLITIALIIGGIVIANLVGGGGTSAAKVAVVDGVPASATASAVEDETIEIVAVDDRAAGEALLRGDEVDAVLVPSDSPVGYTVIGLTSPPDGVVNALAVTPPVELLDPNAVSDGLRYLVAYGFGLVFMMSALGSGAMIMQNTITEKQSRIVEILLAAVPARALMAGKIIGNSIIGVGSAVVMAAAVVLGLAVTGQAQLLALLTAPMVWFVVFFLLGFVLVASIFAAGAAMVSRQEDSGAVMTPAMMLVMLPFMGVAFFGTNLTVMQVLSYVPFSAPVAMPARMFFGEALWWEPVLSLGILAATTGLVVMLAARIYTGSLLRMGNRVKLSEALGR